MAQVIKLKRSAVTGKTPQTSSLQLGELAVNTTDGKIYLHRSSSSDDSIQSVLTTDATITGSLKLSGSQHISGSTNVMDDINYGGSLSSSLGSTSSFDRFTSVGTSSIGFLIATGSNLLNLTQAQTGSFASSSDVQQILDESGSYLVDADTGSLGKVTLISDITGSITSTGSFGKIFGDGSDLDNVADPAAISGSYLGLLSGSHDLTLGLGASGSLLSTASFGVFKGDGSQLSNVSTETGSFASGSDLHQILAESSSYVVESETGSFASGSDIQIIQAESASYVVSTNTGSFVVNSQTSSFASGSDLQIILAESASYVVSTNTGSFLQNTDTASLQTVGIHDTLFVSGNITTSGSVIAREFKTEFISSSIIYSSGSNEFGDTIDDTHIFTGSILLTGSLTMDTGSITLLDGDITGSILSTGSFGKLFGDGSDLSNLPESFTSAQISGSFQGGGSDTISGSLISTASFGTLELVNSHGFVRSTETGSFASGSDLQIIQAESASYVVSTNTGSFVVNSQTGSFASGSDLQIIQAESASYVVSTNTGSFVVNSQTGSFASGSDVQTIEDTYASGSDLQVILAESASYVVSTNTGSFLQNADTASLSSLDVAGNISGSITSTGSFGRVNFDGVNGHTFLQEVTADSLEFQAGGVKLLEIISGSTHRVRIPDSVRLTLGTGNDFHIEHSGTDTFISKQTSGDLYIQNQEDDKDIIFRTDDGSGGLANYLQLDGSTSRISIPSDSIKLTIGAGADIKAYHDGTNSYITNATGNLIFSQQADDENIDFKNDDGSGGVTTYIRLDGSKTKTTLLKDISGSLGTTGSFDRLEANTLNASISPFASGSDVSQIQALTASYATGSDLHQFLAESSSYVVESETGSFVVNSQTGSYASGSDLQIIKAESASYVVSTNTSSFLQNSDTASFSTLFVQGNIATSGSITAQEYIVNSSVTNTTQSFSSGSTIFGDSTDDTHEFSGSVQITGSQSVVGDLEISSSIPSLYFVDTDTPITNGIQNYNGAMRLFTDKEASHGGSNISFRIDGAGDSKEVARFINKGLVINVGSQGTTAMDENFLVNGDAGITGSLFVSSSITTPTTGSFGRVDATGTIKTSGQIEIGSNSNFLTSQLKVGDGTRDIRLNANHGSEAVVGTVGSHEFNLMTNNTFRVNIDGDNLGGMGIGMDAKGDEKLVVAGPVGITGSLHLSGSITTPFGVSSASLAYLEITGSAAGDLNKIQVANGGGLYSKLATNERSTVRLIDYSTGNLTRVGGNQELTLAGGTIVNELGNNSDFRVETGGNTHGIFLDSSEEALGIFTSTPTSELTVEGDVSASGNFITTATGSVGRLNFDGVNGHTFIQETSNDVLKIIVGGEAKMEFDEGSENIFMQANNYNFRDASFNNSFKLEADNHLFSGSLTSTGSFGNVEVKNHILLPDSAIVNLGNGRDLKLKHDGNSSITNTSGNITILNTADDKDIILKTDDGSGGSTAYLTLDGSTTDLSLTPPGITHLLEANQGTPASTYAAPLSASLVIEDDGTPTKNSIVIKTHNVGEDSVIGALKFVSSPDSGNYNWTGIQGIAGTSGMAQDLVFYTSDSNTGGVTSTERLRITQNLITASIASTASFGRIEADQYSLATLSEVSGGLTSTGSFGHLVVVNGINAVGRTELNGSLVVNTGIVSSKDETLSLRRYEVTNNSIDIGDGQQDFKMENRQVLQLNASTTTGFAGISGSLTMSGSIIPLADNHASFDLGSASKRWNDVFAVQTTVGAVFETGLRSKGIGKEETGTIVVWRNGGLVPCDKSEDTMVMGVVKQGKDEPIVMGAEPVLVTGDVKEGDFITTSTKLGHGKKLENGYLLKKEMFGKVIAQALENASGNSSLIKCMIRKM